MKKKSLFLAILFTTLPALAEAQIAVDKLEIYLTPNKISPIAESFVITNKGEDPMQLVLNVQDWDRAENGNNRFYDLSTKPGSCGRALSAFPSRFRLASGENQQLRIAVAVTDTLKAPCWGIVFVQTVLPRKNLKGRSITYILRTGVKVYVHPQSAIADGAIDSMAVKNILAVPAIPAKAKTRSAPAVLAVPAVPASRSLIIRFANTGARHIQTLGKVELRSTSNVLIKTLEVAEFPTLPAARRIVELPLPDLPRGKYVALAILDFHGPDAVAGQFDFYIP